MQILCTKKRQFVNTTPLFLLQWNLSYTKLVISILIKSAISVYLGFRTDCFPGWSWCINSCIRPWNLKMFLLFPAGDRNWLQLFLCPNKIQFLNFSDSDFLRCGISVLIGTTIHLKMLKGIGGFYLLETVNTVPFFSLLQLKKPNMCWILSHVSRRRLTMFKG